MHRLSDDDVGTMDQHHGPWTEKKNKQKIMKLSTQRPYNDRFFEVWKDPTNPGEKIC
jgi:hypothetical protein